MTCRLAGSRPWLARCGRWKRTSDGQSFLDDSIKITGKAPPQLQALPNRMGVSPLNGMPVAVL